MAKTTTAEKRKPGRPASGHTPKRYFRMDDDSYELVKNAALAADETTSDYIRRVLLRDAKKQSKK